MKPKRWLVGAFWSVVVILVIIGVVAASGRIFVLSDPARGERIATEILERITKVRPPNAAPVVQDQKAVEAGYQQQSALVLAHVVPGLLFMILGPFQFIPGMRSRHPQLHRWSGRIFLLASGVIGTSGLLMGWKTPIGGASETTAITFFGGLFLFELGKAFLHVRRRQIAQHREWMIRAFILGLAIATDRPMFGLFFVFSRMPLPEFFAIALWLSFCLHLVAAEVWINWTRPAGVAKAVEPATASV
jgi:uncharacterized membrane protein